VETSDLCRELGVSDATFHNWKSKHGGMDVNEAQRLRQLEGENRRLKALLPTSPQPGLRRRRAILAPKPKPRDSNYGWMRKTGPATHKFSE